MNEFKKVSPNEMSINPFESIGSDWMLIGAEKDGRVNAMTASWGGLGVMWGKNVAFVFIRESRFTKELVDNSDTFSLTIFDHKQYAGMLAYMGKASGRDEDKIKHTGLTVCHSENTPYFSEASKVFICRKMCRLPVSPDSFIDADIDKNFYGSKDYHEMYVAEIIDALEK